MKKQIYTTRTYTNDECMGLSAQVSRDGDIRHGYARLTLSTVYESFMHSLTREALVNLRDVLDAVLEDWPEKET